MTFFINLSKSPIKELSYLKQDEYRERFDKGWSFSYSYSIIELRNIYLLIKNYGFKNISDFTKLCIKEKLFYEKTPWEERRVLEQINSLKNFGLITKDEKIVNESLFADSSVDSLLSCEDIQTFRQVYFSYHRFCELHSWLVNPDYYSADLINAINEEYVKAQSKAVFPFRSKDRFVDSFIFALEDDAVVYKIAQYNKNDFEGIKRFWDVYVKWGSSLGLAEKFNLSDLNYQLSSNFKSPACFYFCRDVDKEFSLIDYLLDKYKARYIYIPKLVLSLAIEYRFSIENIKRIILDVAKNNPDKISLQKTSEILMRKTELAFIPKSNGFLFSHILLLR